MFDLVKTNYYVMLNKVTRNTEWRLRINKITDFKKKKFNVQILVFTY